MRRCRQSAGPIECPNSPSGQSALVRRQVAALGRWHRRDLRAPVHRLETDLDAEQIRPTVAGTGRPLNGRSARVELRGLEPLIPTLPVWLGGVCGSSWWSIAAGYRVEPTDTDVGRRLWTASSGNQGGTMRPGGKRPHAAGITPGSQPLSVVRSGSTNGAATNAVARVMTGRARDVQGQQGPDGTVTL